MLCSSHLLDAQCDLAKGRYGHFRLLWWQLLSSDKRRKIQLSSTKFRLFIQGLGCIDSLVDSYDRACIVQISIDMGENGTQCFKEEFLACQKSD